MSRIKPEHKVNILSSHHGFTLLGGDPYAEMLKTIRDVIEERTGCKNIRLRAGVGLRFRETEEYIRRYKLDEYFNGKARGVAPVDEGVAIETEIGTLYGIKKIYDADWIVHAHNSDVREVHFHRMVDRAVKPFGMSYARIETRSTYHQNLGPRAANFTARAIFDSPFVQDKFAFSCFLTVVPHGILGVDADNDLYSLNERVTEVGCRYYGKMMTLFGEIDECIVSPRFSMSCRLCILSRGHLRQLCGRQHRFVRSRIAPSRIYLVYGSVLRKERLSPAAGNPKTQQRNQNVRAQLRLDRLSERLFQRAYPDCGCRTATGGPFQPRPAKPQLYETCGFIGIDRIGHGLCPKHYGRRKSAHF